MLHKITDKYEAWSLVGPKDDTLRLFDLIAQNCEPSWIREWQLEREGTEEYCRIVFKAQEEALHSAVLWFVEEKPGSFVGIVHAPVDPKERLQIFLAFWKEFERFLNMFESVEIMDLIDGPPMALVGCAAYACLRQLIASSNKEVFDADEWSMFVCLSYFSAAGERPTVDQIFDLMKQEGVTKQYAREMASRWESAFRLLDCYERLRSQCAKSSRRSQFD